jgi:hypothetical protein
VTFFYQYETRSLPSFGGVLTHHLEARQNAAVPLIPDSMRCSLRVLDVFMGYNPPCTVLQGHCIRLLGCSEPTRIWLVARARLLAHGGGAQGLCFPPCRVGGEHAHSSVVRGMHD